MAVPTLDWLISGSGATPSASDATSFGFYDSDSDFLSDAPKVAHWIARKQGYPILQVELTYGQVYDLFEEAISEYSTIVNNSNMQDWMLNYLGTPTTGSNYTHKFPNNKFTFLHKYGDSVAGEVGSGGKIDWKSGSINLIDGQQNYDIQELWGNVSESNQRISIRDVYHFRNNAAISRAYSPASDFLGTNDLISQIGGSYPVDARTMYYVHPLFEDTLRANAIELNDLIRKSAYSYEIINNKIKIFPVPDSNIKLWFRYTVDNFNPMTNDDTSSGSASNELVSDISNVPYEKMEYNKINSMGKNWIKRYTLVLAKELLGNVRRKYNSLPIPGNELSLDGDSLISDAQTMKEQLLEELNSLLEKTNLETMAERESNLQENINKQMDQFPMLPYIR